MGSEVKGFDSAGERKAVADETLQIHFTVHNKTNRFLLQFNRGAIRAQQSFLVNANRGGVNYSLTMYSLRKQQYPPTRTHSAASA